MNDPFSNKDKRWTERVTRSGYFFGAVLLHLIVFILVATWVIFPAFRSAPEEIPKSFLVTVPRSVPVPPSPASPQPPDISKLGSADAMAGAAPVEPQSFHPDLPGIGSIALPGDEGPTVPPRMEVKPNTPSANRLILIRKLLEKSGRTPTDIIQSDGDPKNIKAKFPVYLASYANGDWDCNVRLTDGKIMAGSLPNLVAKINEWSHGQIEAEMVTTPLNIGGPELMDKMPPFIFFTGHKDFVLTDSEVQNLRDYLQIGGFIWGDNALAGHGSRFDVAFHREMKRVVPDGDKNFQPISPSDDIFTKWFPISQVPSGMNYYSETPEHLDIEGKAAIFYTPNDYSDLFAMRILPGDAEIEGTQPDPKSDSPLYTFGIFLSNRSIFFRNFDLPSCLASEKFGMNIVGYLLVRFDKDLLLAPY